MKLGIGMVCVAALSLAACTDIENTGGGEGIVSSKIPTKTPDLNPVLTEASGLGTILNVLPMRDLCESCVITSYASIDARFTEVRIVTDEDMTPVCTIYIKNGFTVIDECGLFD